MNIAHYFLKFSLMIHQHTNQSFKYRTIVNIMDFYINDSWQAVHCQGAHVFEKRN